MPFERKGFGLGIIRFLLAMAVVLSHIGSVMGEIIFSLPHGIIAVELFFIISGFYMALILSGKYSAPGKVKLFYLNRFLRLRGRRISMA